MLRCKKIFAPLLVVLTACLMVIAAGELSGQMPPQENRECGDGCTWHWENGHWQLVGNDCGSCGCNSPSNNGMDGALVMTECG